MRSKKKDMLDKMAKELADRLSALEEQYDRLDDQGRCDYLLLKKIQDLRGQLKFLKPESA
jgi:hypothetical protein